MFSVALTFRLESVTSLSLALLAADSPSSEKSPVQNLQGPLYGDTPKLVWLPGSLFLNVVLSPLREEIRTYGDKYLPGRARREMNYSLWCS